MKTYIVLSNNKVVDIIESSIQPVFTLNFTVLDGSKFDMSTVKHGYIYSTETDSFTEPEETEESVPVIEFDDRIPTESELAQAKLILNSELILIYKEIEMEMV